MIPLLWKRAFFDICHHTSCDKCLGTYVGRLRNCMTKDEKSKGKDMRKAVASQLGCQKPWRYCGCHRSPRHTAILFQSTSAPRVYTYRIFNRDAALNSEILLT
jgi:hypothetical protein